MKDLGYKQTSATQIWEDNQGAIALANKTGYNARTKHVDIRHHFIREKVSSGDIKIDYVETQQQLADILTKALATKRLSTFAIVSASYRAESSTVDREWECCWAQPTVSRLCQLMHKSAACPCTDSC